MGMGRPSGSKAHFFIKMIYIFCSRSLWVAYTSYFVYIVSNSGQGAIYAAVVYSLRFQYQALYDVVFDTRNRSNVSALENHNI